MVQETHHGKVKARQTKKALVSTFAGLLPFDRPQASGTRERFVETTLLATARRSSITDASEAYARIHTDTYFDHPRPVLPAQKEVSFVFATNLGDVLPALAVFLATHCHDRWGIESGDRVKDTLRVRTSSDAYGVRLFLQLASIIAYNLWTLVRALHATRPRTPFERGRRDRFLVRHHRDDLVRLLVE